MAMFRPTIAPSLQPTGAARRRRSSLSARPSLPASFACDGFGRGRVGQSGLHAQASAAGGYLTRRKRLGLGTASSPESAGKINSYQ
jgi:hypothetical protein